MNQDGVDNIILFYLQKKMGDNNYITSTIDCFVRKEMAAGTFYFSENEQRYVLKKLIE